MKTRLVGMLAAAAVMIAASPARAQLPHITPFSFEARGGGALPTGDFNDVADPGPTLEGSVTFHAFPFVGLYGAYRWTKFGGEGDGEFTETGPGVGVRVDIPTPLIPIDPWIRAGAAFRKIEGEGFTNPALNFESDTQVGIEVGAGIGFGFGPVSLTPSVAYVTYEPDGAPADFDVSYWRADVGLRIRL